MQQSNLSKALIRGVGPQNKQVETSTEEIQSLSKKLGRPVPPTDPQSVQQMGGSPQQAAMAGSRANLQSTLKQAVSPEDTAPATLRDTLRRETGRTQLTEAETRQKEFKDKLAAGASQLTQQNVQEKALGQFTFENKDPAEVSLNLIEEYDWVREAAEEDPAIGESLGKVLTGQAGPSDLSKIMNMKKADGTPLVPTEELGNEVEYVRALFGDTQAQTALAASEAVIDYEDFGVNDLYIGEGAEEEIANLAEGLGLSVEEVQGMSLQQVMDEMDRVVQSDYQRTQQLMNQATDINLSPAERARARKSLKDMGATGIASMELTEIDQLAEQVAEADTVKVGDEEIELSELLDDEKITEMIGSYFNGDMFAKEQLEKLPGLKAFVDENQKAFSEALTNLDTQTKTLVQNRTESNSNIQELAQAGVDEKVIDTILNEQGLDRNSYSDKIISFDVMENKTTQKVIVSDIPNIDKAELAMMDESQLKEIENQMGLTERDRTNTLNNYTASRNDYSEIQAYREAGMDSKEIAKELLKLDDTKLSQTKDMAALKSLGVSGITGSFDSDIFTSDGELKPTWAEDISMAKGVDDLRKGGPSKTFSSIENSLPKAQGNAYTLLEKGAITPDGKVDGAKLISLANDGEVSVLNNIAKEVGVDNIKNLNELGSAYTKTATFNTEFTERFNSIKYPTDPFNTVDELFDITKGGRMPKHVWDSRINEYGNQLFEKWTSSFDSPVQAAAWKTKLDEFYVKKEQVQTNLDAIASNKKIFGDIMAGDVEIL